MPKISAGQALTAWGELSTLQSREMPLNAALAVSRLLTELNIVDTERRKLLKKYAKLNDAGDFAYETLNPQIGPQIVIIPEKAQEFSAAFGAWSEQEIEITQTIKASMLESLSVRPALLMALGPLLVEE